MKPARNLLSRERKIQNLANSPEAHAEVATPSAGPRLEFCRGSGANRVTSPPDAAQLCPEESAASAQRDRGL